MIGEECCFVVKHTFLELSPTEVTTCRQRSFSDSVLFDTEDHVDSVKPASKLDEVDSDASTTDAEFSAQEHSTSESDSDGERQVDRMPMTVAPPCMLTGAANMVYMMQMTPNGPMLCAVPAAPQTSLEQHSVAMEAYASQLAMEARRAKTAAANAARKESGSWVGQRKSSVGSSCEVSFPNDREEVENDTRTTLMFRNLPNNYTRASLLDMLDEEGFNKFYSFVYLPTDFKNFAGFGYAFVNFATHEAAVKAKHHFQGYCKWSVPSQKVCEVVWSGPVQGLSAHTDRYRNSPVMHESVPDEYKPVVFVDGRRVRFPPPTRKIRAPRVRNGIAVESQVH